MIRLLAILVAAVLIAAAAAWVADQQGVLAMTAGSYEIRMTTPVAIALLIVFAFAIGLFTRIADFVLSGPGAVGAWWTARRMRRGHDAISRGLIAAAAGDAVEAHGFVRRAQSVLGAHPLSLLLSAQAAQLDGDEAGQRKAYDAMLRHEETEFLGLRGLFMLARRDDNHEEAERLAARAHLLKPRAKWAVNALFDLKSGRAQWRDAMTILKGASDIGIVDADVARRRRAVLLAAEARDAEHHGDFEAALSTALEALSLSPALAPAATLAARRLIAQGKVWRAQDVIEAAWTQSPHPDLADAYAAIVPNEAPAARAKRMLDLARLNRDHFESRMLEAEQAILMRDWVEARRLLAPLAAGFPSARVCSLMAEIEEGQWSNASAAHEWLARAGRAPRDAEWRCGHCGFPSPDWTPVCSACGAFDTLSWAAPTAEILEKLPADDHPVATEGEGGLHEALPLAHAALRPRLARPETRLASRSVGGQGEHHFVVLPRPPDDPGPVGAEHEDATPAGIGGD